MYGDQMAEANFKKYFFSLDLNVLKVSQQRMSSNTEFQQVVGRFLKQRKASVPGQQILER